jgi:hypothetical protein
VVIPSIERSAAWAPGIETVEQLQAWFAGPRRLGAHGHPEAKFLPAMLRRRCTPLTKIMLTAAYGACDPAELSDVRTVFASRHGSINESIGLLEAIAASGRVSAATFSHSVHNAQAGLFSIAVGNRKASSSLAGQEDSFPAGFLEALTHLHRAPAQKVLLVMGDVPLAETFAPLIDEPPSSYGVGLLLASGGDGPRVSIELDPGPDSAPSPPPWPAAFEFLRWLQGGEPQLRIQTPRRTWTFQRR